MPPKIIPATNKEGYVPEKKRYSKPKPYVMSESLKEYIKERDRHIYKTTKDESTKQAIRERYGVEPKTS